MDGEHSMLGGQDNSGELGGDGVLACINNGGISLSESFMHQRKLQMLRAADEREKRSIRENHLKHETFKIIESLIEGRTDEEYLIKCASLLCQTDLDNVHEERSLAFFCGYPLCDNRLEQLSAKQKSQIFKIDTRNRQIYRMEEFKQFCSVLCYKSSHYLREQMSPEPLWMRYTDVGGYDELYKKGFSTLRLYHPKAESDCEELEKTGTMNQSCQRSEVKGQISVRDSVSFPYIKQEHLEHLRKSIQTLTIKERNVSENSSELEPSEEVLDEAKKVIEQKQEDQRSVKIECEQKEQEIQVSINSPVKCDHQPATTETNNQSVFERLKEWMTFESFIFIFGSSIIDEIIQLQRLKINEGSGQENQAEENEGLKKKKMDDHVEEICKKLDDEEIVDQLIFETDQVEVARQKAEKADYNKRKLRGEDTALSKQVKCQKGGGKKVSFDPTVSVAVCDDPAFSLPLILPPTSSKSQNRLRKQLFCRQLERTISLQKINPEVVVSICPLFRDLIDTFKFTSTNVVVPNDDWPELLLILLQILDFREENNPNITAKTAIMDERSVIRFYQKICPDESSLHNFKSKVSILLDYHESSLIK